jgi:methylenetetrahydrofolate--tRNA-(uracil-5-)-methyltransferase
MNRPVTVIGAGLAGCEAVWALAKAGEAVRLYEMKPVRFSPAHHSENFAELVCSNSLKASRLETASGLLKAEMKRLGSLTMEAAEAAAVPAGGALAVYREAFSAYITERIRSLPNVEIVREELTELPSEGTVVCATGPLPSDGLASYLSGLFGGTLSFYDAVAPIVSADSIDFTKCFYGARWGHGDPDYLNCPMDKEQYEAFVEALLNAEKAELHAFDAPPKVYEGCMPVEIMAARAPIRCVTARCARRAQKPGDRTSPLGQRPAPKENQEGTMLNLVGFQTNLKWGEQKRVFSMIPGLEHAEFLRYGVMHRDTFMDSPRLLAENLSLRSDDRLFFAGQLTGVEGYMESAATGILAGITARRHETRELLSSCRRRRCWARWCGTSPTRPSRISADGQQHGLAPPAGNTHPRQQERYLALSERALAAGRHAEVRNPPPGKEIFMKIALDIYGGDMPLWLAGGRGCGRQGTWRRDFAVGRRPK